MKILMYGWEFPPHISGGLGVACSAIVNELAKHKLQLTLVLPHTINKIECDKKVKVIGCDQYRASGDSLNLAKLFGFDLKNTSQFTFLHPYLNIKNLSSALKNFNSTFNANDKHKLYGALKNHHELLNLLDSDIELTGSYGINLLAEVFYYAILAGKIADFVPHDVIHAHDWLTILAGVEAKKRSNKPLVYHVHALEPDRSGDAIDSRIYAIEKFGLQNADKIAAVSKYTKKMIVDKYGIDPAKIHVVYNGMYLPKIHLPKFAPQKNHKMVLFVGRLAHQKGPFHFIKIAQKILSKRQDVHFVIVGTGGLMREMIHSVAASRLGMYIHFTGFLEPKKVMQMYNLADVYVMPSISEPFGLSCLEALSNKVPVVISKQSGVSELLRHVFKVDFWDINEMANKIIALLDYRALRKESFVNTQTDLQVISWKKTATVLVDIYKKLMRK